MDLGQIFTAVGFLLVIVGLILKILRVKKDVKAISENIELMCVCLGVVVTIVGFIL